MSMKKTPKDKALEIFYKSYNCAQAIFITYSEKVGINEYDAKRITAGFGGGIAMNQKICGALTGAIILFGCKFFNEKDVKASKKDVYEKINKFLYEFKKLHKSTECIELLGVEFSTPDGMNKVQDKNLFKTICTPLEKYIPEFFEE